MGLKKPNKLSLMRIADLHSSPTAEGSDFPWPIAGLLSKLVCSGAVQIGGETDALFLLLFVALFGLVTLWVQFFSP